MLKSGPNGIAADALRRARVKTHLDLRERAQLGGHNLQSGRIRGFEGRAGGKEGGRRREAGTKGECGEGGCLNAVSGLGGQNTTRW